MQTFKKLSTMHLRTFERVLGHNSLDLIKPGRMAALAAEHIVLLLVHEIL